MKSPISVPGCLRPLCWGPFCRGKQKNPVWLPLSRGEQQPVVCAEALTPATDLAPFPEHHVCILKNFIEVVNKEKL